jgi:hypothetical protein
MYNCFGKGGIMKKGIVLVLCLFLFPVLAYERNESPAIVAYGSGYECPDDGCSLVYTGKDEFCVGIKCRHVQIYRCGCCGKSWRVYVD